MSRSELKLSHVKNILQKEGVEVKIIPLDLTKASNEEFASIYSEDRPTSIVVNNAGYLNCEFFFDQDPKDIEQTLGLNMLPYVLNTKNATNHFVKNMDSHKHHSSIVHLASILSDIPAPSLAVYSGTKSFNDVFAR